MSDTKLHEGHPLARRTSRTSGRQRVGESTTLRVDGRAFDITVLDLSYQGFGASSDIYVSAGTPVRIGIPGIGVFDAKVVWSRDGLLGGYFDIPLTSRQLMNAFDSQVVVAGNFRKRFSTADDSIHNKGRFPIAARISIILAISAALWVTTTFLVLFFALPLID